MKLYYTKAEFFSSLSAMDAASRMSYLMIHIADYIFMLGVYPLMGYIVARNFEKPSWVSLIPLLAFVFDLLENTIIDLHLLFYPAQAAFAGTIASISTPLKFAAFFLSVGLIIAALVKAVFIKRDKGIGKG